MDQPGKVANPTRGQLNRENNIPLSHSGLIKKNNREKVRVYSTEHNASWGYFLKLIRGVFFLLVERNIVIMKQLVGGCAW